MCKSFGTPIGVIVLPLYYYCMRWGANTYESKFRVGVYLLYTANSKKEEVAKKRTNFKGNKIPSSLRVFVMML